MYIIIVKLIVIFFVLFSFLFLFYVAKEKNKEG